MNRVLLDTSAYSALHRGHEALQDAIRRAEVVALSPVVLGELLDGFRRGSRRARNEQELTRFLAVSRVQLVTVDETTADWYATILGSLRAAGTPIATNDIWIAASAAQHGFRVLTTDSDYGRVPHVLCEVFSPGGGPAR